MRVVLDSSVLVSDPHLLGTSSRLFLEWVRAEGADLFVPKIVLDEVIMKHRRDLQKLGNQLVRVHQDLYRLTGDSNLVECPLDEAKLDKLSLRYYRQLRRKLTKAGTIILGYPDVAHADLARKAMRRKKPFQENGTGYRDSLIWECVLSLAKTESEQIAFISENKRDFASTTGTTLHEDLRAELVAAGVPGERVSYYSSLKPFVDQFVLPAFERVDAIRDQLAAGSFEGLDLRKQLLKSLTDTLFGREVNAQALGLPSSIFSDIALNQSHLNSLIIESVVRLSKEEIFVAGSAVLEVTLSANVRNEDLARLDMLAVKHESTELFSSDMTVIRLRSPVPFDYELTYNVRTRHRTSQSLQWSRPWSLPFRF